LYLCSVIAIIKGIDMKKLVVLVALLATISMTAQAQFGFGVKGGLNLSKLSLNKGAIGADNQVGFHIGPTVKFMIPGIGLGIDAAALFDQRSSDIEARNAETGDLTTTKVKQQSLQVPIHLRYGFGLGSVANIFIFAGPQFGFNLGDKETSIWDGAADWTFRSSSLSANAGLGVLLIKHLQISVNYNFALGKTGDVKVLNWKAESVGKNGDTFEGKMNCWQLSLAYYF
jgi:hypothetical protein